MKDQDRRKTRACLGLESLEGRELTSTGAGLKTNLVLEGTAQGVPSRVVGGPDVGTTVDLHGTGNFQGLGPARLSGSLHGTGLFASSRVEGTITLANAQGNVTLGLQGPSVGRFTAPGSGLYTYTLEKGTGAFRHDVGTGPVALTLGSRSFTLGLPGQADPGLIGTSRARLEGARPPRDPAKSGNQATIPRPDLGFT